MPGATLRERKKQDTRRALVESGRELVLRDGLDAVTVEDIAAAAGVSVRTLFNYFSGKDDVLVGIEPTVLEELADQVRARPRRESPVAAVRAVLVPHDDAEVVARTWQVRNDLVARYPSLLPRHLATILLVEEALAGAVADRLGLDAVRDPRPRVIAAAALAEIRAAAAWWEGAGRPIPFRDALDRAVQRRAR